MDMSFCEPGAIRGYLCGEPQKLKPQVYVVPENLDKEIAPLKLGIYGYRLESSTAEQEPTHGVEGRFAQKGCLES